MVVSWEPFLVFFCRWFYVKEWSFLNWCSYRRTNRSSKIRWLLLDGSWGNCLGEVTFLGQILKFCENGGILLHVQTQGNELSIQRLITEDTMCIFFSCLCYSLNHQLGLFLLWLSTRVEKFHSRHCFVLYHLQTLGLQFSSLILRELCEFWLRFKVLSSDGWEGL